MKTYSTKASEIKREWHVIDASEKVLGKVAAEAAVLLMDLVGLQNNPKTKEAMVPNAKPMPVFGTKQEMLRLQLDRSSSVY